MLGGNVLSDVMLDVICAKCHHSVHYEKCHRAKSHGAFH
jgi:hypothetical protein